MRKPFAAPRPAKAQGKRAPVETALMPLPEGVDEEIDIFCNGREALFLVRSQRVLYEGEEMPPSRFEAVCGKGDAKKWKATLLYFDRRLQQATASMQVRKQGRCLQPCMRLNGAVSCSAFCRGSDLDARWDDGFAAYSRRGSQGATTLAPTARPSA